MGKPGWGHAQSGLPEHIGQVQGTRGTETSQYPEEEKTTSDPPSSGERTGVEPKPNACQAGRRCVFGVVGSFWRICRSSKELPIARVAEQVGKPGHRR